MQRTPRAPVIGAALRRRTPSRAQRLGLYASVERRQAFVDRRDAARQRSRTRTPPRRYAAQPSSSITYPTLSRSDRTRCTTRRCVLEPPGRGDSSGPHDLAIHIIARHANPGEALRNAKVYLLKWHDEGQLPYAPLVRKIRHADSVVRDCQRLLEGVIEKPMRPSGSSARLAFPSAHSSAASRIRPEPHRMFRPVIDGARSHGPSSRDRR